MRVAVAGGTGLVGRSVVESLIDDGHDPVVISRSTGVDLLTGEGLRKTLEGVAAVIDVTNTPGVDPEQTRAFFGTVSRNLLAAERDTGVAHHVLLSILGIDRVDGNGHYAGKRLQEELARDTATAVTIVRAAQFFEFAEMVVQWTLRGSRAVLPPLLIQPLAVRDLSRMLATVATGGVESASIDVAGPEPQDLVDMARRALTARGQDIELVPSWRGPFQADMAGEVLLPGEAAHLTTTTFQEWLGGSDLIPRA